jgi:beta-glucosidase
MRSFRSVRLALLPGLIAVACLCWAATKPKPLSSFDPQAKALLAKMTLEEKAGQMTQAETNELNAGMSDIETLSLGSILSGGNGDPKEGNSLKAWTDMYDSIQVHSQKMRLKIPVLYGVDTVHGHNNVIGAVVMPHNIGLGCTRNPKLIAQVQKVAAAETRATGIQWAFSPCVAAAQDIRWGRTYEAFSEDPQLVRELGGPAVAGLQGKGLDDPLGVAACAKHYVGDGGTAFGSAPTGLDQGDTRVDEATLRKIHLQGYYTAIEAGVPTIMPSYNKWNGVKCSASKRLMTEILKDEMKFQGFLISDYNAIEQITPDFKEAIAISINAGMDMAMVPKRYKEFYDDLLALVKEGKIPMSRIDDAVLRILRVKFAMGMMDPKRSQLADRKLWNEFGSPAHRAVARQAVRESLVLLKNDSKTLPLAKTAARIHVAGKNADDLGNQCGGWTIDWQGKSGELTTGGTTILAAIKNTVSKGTQVTFSKDGSGAKGATAGIVVIGEKPYAEMMGDRADLKLDAEDLAAVQNMKDAGIPVVVVVVSGRPLILGDVKDQAASIVAAWLPGTEGQGVADVLFGDHKPTGKLSFTWPKAVGQGKADPLYAFGYGLTY